MTYYLGNFSVISKQLIEMRRLDVKSDLTLADLVLTRHPKSEATFAHRLEMFNCFLCLICCYAAKCLIMCCMSCTDVNWL